MSTVLYTSPIFGPVHSRRLGVSLGVNLMPSDGKVCTFDCIYCECGLNNSHRPSLPRPTREEVATALKNKLQRMLEDNMLPDVITFAGNGEPTAHPNFAEIIDDTISLRNKYCPLAKVSVLSNATLIVKDSVRDALIKVDNNILKLDTVSSDYISLVDQPVSRHYDVYEIVANMKKFNGKCIIQTMFMTGEYKGKSVDNTSDDFVLPWLKTLKEIMPMSVMIYTIDRETPVTGLQKATRERLDLICEKVKACGIPCTASY